MMCDLDHSPPVNHTWVRVPLQEWLDECVWAQLQWEREQSDGNPNYTSPAYLANLEKEWGRRSICSRCHRAVDESLDAQMSDLQTRVQDATDKLGRIRRLLITTSDAALRREIAKILDER